MIVDTSALYGFFDAKDKHHETLVKLLTDCNEPLVVSPFVIAELDYLVMTRMGVTAELAVLNQLCGGAWDIQPVLMDDLRRATNIVTDYADDSIGITDAVNISLAERCGTTTIATLDRRHVAVLRHVGGTVLNIVPAA